MSGPASGLYAPLPDLWDDAHAAKLDEPNLLLYRSNLLGSDLRITNFGGGNTSAKIDGADPLTGETVKVLWVKGSGGDIGSMKLDGFSTLYLDKLLSLRSIYRGLEHEDAGDDCDAIFDACTARRMQSTWLVHLVAARCGAAAGKGVHSTTQCVRAFAHHSLGYRARM